MSGAKVDREAAAGLVRWAFVFGFLLGALVASIIWSVAS